MTHRIALAAAFLAALITNAQAAEKVTAGVVGGYNAFTWPIAIANANGLYTKRGIDLDVIFISSAPGMLQQATSGSLDVAIGTGMVNPIRLVARGNPTAVARIELRVSPYALISKPGIKTIAALRGKNVGIGSPNDATHVLIEKMLAAEGLKLSDVNMLYSGATGARYAALKTGAYDAALLAPPLNFTAVGEGYTLLGIAGDYTKDLPFSGTVVNRRWATANMDTARKFLAANDEATDWLRDKANRKNAIAILVKASNGKDDDLDQTYDFFQKGDFFDHTHKVSRRGIRALVDAVHELGDTDVNPTPEQCIVPGLTELSE